jgi:hypothetical protein
VAPDERLCDAIQNSDRTSLGLLRRFTLRDDDNDWPSLSEAVRRVHVM